MVVNPEKLLKPREFCGIIGINYRTFKWWVAEDRIHVVRTPTGRMRVSYSEIERIFRGKTETREARAIIYARISSSDQGKDLERQIEYLTRYCSAKDYKLMDVPSDIVSDLKTNRRGPMKLFSHVVNRKVDVVVVTYKDRLTRFGFEYLEYFFKQYSVSVDVVYGEEPKDAYQELVEDLLAFITSFAGKLYGMRSRKKRSLSKASRSFLEEVERDD